MDTERPLLGTAALVQANRNFANTLCGYKATMGCTYEEYKANSLAQSHVQTQESKSRELEFLVTHQGLSTVVNPEDVLSHIISHVKSVITKQNPGADIAFVMASSYNMVLYLFFFFVLFWLENSYKLIV